MTGLLQPAVKARTRVCRGQIERSGNESRGNLRLQYFPEQDLVLASQLPPSFWHCCWACLSVSPAKAGTVKVTARVAVNTDIKVLTTHSPLSINRPQRSEG